MMMHLLLFVVLDRPEKEPPLFFAANERRLFEERLFPKTMMPTQKKAHLAPKRTCVSLFLCAKRK